MDTKDTALVDATISAYETTISTDNQIRLLKSSVRCDDHFHRWRAHRVHCAQADKEIHAHRNSELYGYQNVLPHLLPPGDDAWTSDDAVMELMPSCIASVPESLGPIQGVRHPDGWFMELFPRRIVQPLQTLFFGVDPNETTPCPELDLNLTINEQTQALIRNVMHMALDAPDDVFSRARWIKPSRSVRKGAEQLPWTEVMCFSLDWLTPAPKHGEFVRMRTTLLEAQTGKPHRMSKDTFYTALRHFPNLFSLCYHVIETYMAGTDSNWFRLLQTRHNNTLATDNAEWAQRMRTGATADELRARETALRSGISSIGPKLRGANYMQVSSTCTSSTMDTRDYKALRVETPFMIPTETHVVRFQHALHRPRQAPVLFLPKSAIPSGTATEQILTARATVLSTVVTHSLAPACASRINRRMKANGHTITQQELRIPPRLLMTQDLISRMLCSVHLNSKPIKHADLHQVTFCRWPRSGDMRVPNASDPYWWTKESVWRAVNVDICENDRIVVMQYVRSTYKTVHEACNMFANSLLGFCPLLPCVSGTNEPCATFSIGIRLAGACELLRIAMNVNDTSGSAMTMDEASAVLIGYKKNMDNPTAGAPDVISESRIRMMSLLIRRVTVFARSSPTMFLHDSVGDRNELVRTTMSILHDMYRDGSYGVRTDFQLAGLVSAVIIPPNSSIVAGSDASVDIQRLWTSCGAQARKFVLDAAAHLAKTIIDPVLRQVHGVAVTMVKQVYADELRSTEGRGFPVVRASVNALIGVRRMYQQGTGCREGMDMCMEQLSHVNSSYATREFALAAFIPGLLATYIEQSTNGLGNRDSPPRTRLKRKRDAEQDVAALLDSGVGHAIAEVFNKLRRIHPTASCWRGTAMDTPHNGMQRIVLDYLHSHELDPDRGFAPSSMDKLLRSMASTPRHEMQNRDQRIHTIAKIIVDNVRICSESDPLPPPPPPSSILPDFDFTLPLPLPPPIQPLSGDDNDGLSLSFMDTDIEPQVKLDGQYLTRMQLFNVWMMTARGTCVSAKTLSMSVARECHKYIDDELKASLPADIPAFVPQSTKAQQALIALATGNCTK